MEGKVAVITGGGGVIGQVVAATFVREGARVLVADWNGAERWVAAELGAAAVPLHVDVTKEDEIEKMFAPAVAEFGCFDVSVHLAGPNGARRAAEMSQDEFQQIFAHLGGMSMCTKHAIRAMASNGGGAILNFSSVASLNYSPWISIAYSAAKAGINSMTRSYAAEYGAQGIRINAIAPGLTMSDEYRRLPSEQMSILNSKAALGRVANPSDQAEVAAFLCSDRAGFVTGAVVPVDGGWSTRLA